MNILRESPSAQLLVKICKQKLQWGDTLNVTQKATPAKKRSDEKIEKEN